MIGGGLATLGETAIERLVTSLRSGALTWPPGQTSLAGIVGADAAPDCSNLLQSLAAQGTTCKGAAAALELVLLDRRSTRGVIPRPEVVWSGTEGVHAMTRDTRIVAQELFMRAEKRLDIASYSVDEGRKARELFGALATRLDREPELEVRMFLNVKRAPRDSTPTNVLSTRFATFFRQMVWPGQRLPEVYFDRRALEDDGHKRTCQHAKLIVADLKRSLVTSANFSEAAHTRNIEAGLLVEDPHVAGVIVKQLDDLIRIGVFERSL